DRPPWAHGQQRRQHVDDLSAGRRIPPPVERPRPGRPPADSTACRIAISNAQRHACRGLLATTRQTRRARSRLHASGAGRPPGLSAAVPVGVEGMQRREDGLVVAAQLPGDQVGLHPLAGLCQPVVDLQSLHSRWRHRLLPSGY
ncbi:MAG: hypothetical protein ACXVCX_22050, partial [Ktedonobacterales bacterium]